MNDYIIWTIITTILAAAIAYIIMQKRKGVKCVGCASEAQCACSSESKQQCACGEGSKSIHNYSKAITSLN